MVHKVNSGHPGGSLGCVEFFVTLYKRILNIDSDQINKDVHQSKDKILYFKKVIKPSDDEYRNHETYLKKSLKKNFFN